MNNMQQATMPILIFQLSAIVQNYLFDISNSDMRIEVVQWFQIEGAELDEVQRYGYYQIKFTKGLPNERSRLSRQQIFTQIFHVKLMGIRSVK